METNGVQSENTLNQTVAPTTQGEEVVSASGVENQSNGQEIAELQKTEAELDRYINSKGGIDKVKEFTERIAEKRALVEQHKQATKDNSNFITEERIESLQANHMAVQQTPQQVQASVQVENNKQPQIVIDELNRQITRDLEAQFPEIKEEIASGEIYKKANALGINFMENGVVSRDRIAKYAELEQAKKINSMPKAPSSAPSPEDYQPRPYQPVPAGQMTIAMARKIINEAYSTNSWHPEMERAVQVFRSGKNG